MLSGEGSALSPLIRRLVQVHRSQPEMGSPEEFGRAVVLALARRVAGCSDGPKAAIEGCPKRGKADLPALTENAEVQAILGDERWESLWEREKEYLFGVVYVGFLRAAGWKNIPNGLYLTPLDIGRRLAERAVRLWLDGSPGKPPRILDPACGPGGFLVWALESLVGLWRNPPVGVELTGTDIDSGLLQVADLSLSSATRRLGEDSPIQTRLLCTDWLRWNDPQPGYDIIMVNPPWVSLKGRFRKTVYSPAEVESLLDIYGGNHYRPNLAEFFVLKCFRLLGPGGILALVLPDRFAANLQYAPLRRMLLDEAEISELRLGFRIPGVVSDNLGLILRKGRPGKRHKVKIARDGKRARKVPQSALRSGPHADLTDAPVTSAGAGDRRPVSPAKRDCGDMVPLGELVQSSVGFIARRGTVTHERVSGEQQEVLRGRDIGPYAVRGCAFFHFCGQNLAGGTRNRDKLSATPRILVRKTGDRLVAAWDDSGRYPEQSLYILYRPGEGVSLPALLGWLNSCLLNDRLLSSFLTNAGCMAQIKKVHLDRLPVPAALARENEELEDLVSRRIALGADSETGTQAEDLERKIEETVRSLAISGSRDGRPTQPRLPRPPRRTRNDGKRRRCLSGSVVGQASRLPCQGWIPAFAGMTKTG